MVTLFPNRTILFYNSTICQLSELTRERRRVRKQPLGVLKSKDAGAATDHPSESSAENLILLSVRIRRLRFSRLRPAAILSS